MNGLDTVSRLMVDKVTTVPKATLGKRIVRSGRRASRERAVSTSPTFHA